MPTYDYKCIKCGYEKEFFISLQEGAWNSIHCEDCQMKMQKQVSKPAGIHFKGSGFYQTDYKDKK